MKTLYISDLDGTLLNQQVELSKYTIDIINKIIAKGIYFSVATARTPATAPIMLKNIKVNAPAILMNGVIIYDLEKKKYLKKEIINKSSVNKILKIIKENNQTGLMYSLRANELIVYYETLDKESIKDFIDIRIKKYNKKFTKIGDFANSKDAIVYFTFRDTIEVIEDLYEKLKDIEDIRIEAYPDNYTDHLWYLEIFNSNASKYNALNFLRKEYGFDKIICFGDNLNDISLFEASDECYAVANAKNELKEKATAIIDSNKNNGVAKWLEKNLL